MTKTILSKTAKQGDTLNHLAKTTMRLTTLSAILLTLSAPAIAQKDGAPTAVAGEQARPMAPNGVPTVVKIPAGTFLMGADTEALPASITKGFGVMSARPDHGDFDELPAHQVRIPKSFAIGLTEVTPQEYQQFDPKYTPGSATPAYAAGVSWQQAMDYCAWLSKKTGKPCVSPPKPNGSTPPAPEANRSSATPTPLLKSIPPTPSVSKTWA